MGDTQAGTGQDARDGTPVRTGPLPSSSPQLSVHVVVGAGTGGVQLLAVVDG